MPHVIEFTQVFCYKGEVKEYPHNQPDHTISRPDAGKSSSGSGVPDRQPEQVSPQPESPANDSLSTMREKTGNREPACVVSWLIPSPEKLDWMLQEGHISPERAKKVLRLREEIEFRANLAGMVDDGLITKEEAWQRVREFHESRRDT